jgi:hypothetical protein
MPTEIEGLKSTGEGRKTSTTRSRIIENSEEIENEIILLANTSNKISIVCSLEECKLFMIMINFLKCTKKF